MVVDGVDYAVQAFRQRTESVEAPRLVIVAHQPNRLAREVLEACVGAVRAHTKVPYELWVVDNNSPEEQTSWLLECSDLNVILNRTEPSPRSGSLLGRAIRYVTRGQGQRRWGSYANAIGLELGVRTIDPESRYLMSLHMDTMPCRTGWLSFLMSKVSGHVAAAGVRMDTTRTREGVLHVLGCLVDFQRFRQLGLDFLPQLPEYDVGDRVTVGLRRAGYDVYACRNTLWEPELASKIVEDSPFPRLHVDRSLDDQGNVIFLHLGRGVSKCVGDRRTGTSTTDWLAFAEEHVLA